MNKSLVYFFLIFFTLLTCKAQEGCVYNKSIFTNDFLKSSEFVYSYKWDDKEKEGSAILKNGSVLNVKRWACNHIGTSANMMLAKEVFDVNFWKDYIKKLSVIVCGKSEIQLINESLSKTPYDSINKNDCRKEIDVSNEMYPEFYLSVYELEDFTVISIFYYKAP
jgi:hypothetical protein